MKRLPFAGVVVAALAVVVTAGIAVTSPGGDDTDRIEVVAPSTTAAGPSVVAPSTTVESVTTTTPMPLVDLHAQSWNDVVAGDPHLLGTTAPDGTVRYRYIGAEGNTSPFAREPSILAIDEMSYGDISGDGIDEAFVPVLSPQGASTVLVYYATTVAPRSAMADNPYWYPGGSMLGSPPETFEIRDGHLVRTARLYSQNDLPCCPGAMVTTVYALIGGRLLERVPTKITGSGNGWISAVNQFTVSVRARRYDDLYALLAPDLRSRISGDQWHHQFADARAAFAEFDYGELMVLTLTTVHQRGDALVVRRQQGAIRFGFHVLEQGWLIDELDLHDTPYVAPAPKEGFVQGTFDIVTIDEATKSALVLLTCTAPVDKTIATPALITVALAVAHFQLNAPDPTATFGEWVAAARTRLHWHIGISTNNPPPAPPRTYVSVLPTSGLDTCP